MASCRRRAAQTRTGTAGDLRYGIVEVAEETVVFDDAGGQD